MKTTGNPHNSIPAILAEVNLIDLAYSYGYTKEDREKRSAGWIKLVNPATDDKIRIYRNASPLWYRNCAPHLGNDKGNVINFVINRETVVVIPCPNPTREQFAAALKFLKGKTNEEYNTPEEFERAKQERTIPQTQAYNLEEYLHIEIFRANKTDYLTRHRNISADTVNRFQEYIRLSEFQTQNGKVFTNVAFPKYDTHTGEIKGYTVYHRNYGDKPDGKRIYGASDNLWGASAGKPVSVIAVGESEIDCLSHFELAMQRRSPEGEHTFYIATNGGLNDAKIAFIVSKLYAYFPTGKPRLALLHDNDPQGFLYDLLLTVTLYNQYTPPGNGLQENRPYLEMLSRQRDISLILHRFPNPYGLSELLQEQQQILTEKMNQAILETCKPPALYILEDKIVLEFPVATDTGKETESIREMPLHIARFIQEHLCQELTIETLKPPAGKDWNDALKHYKKLPPEKQSFFFP